MNLNPTIPECLQGFSDIKYRVEIGQEESFLFWCKYGDDFERYSSGQLLHVGNILDDSNMPVWISVGVSKFKGVQFIEWHSTSRFVDFTMIDEWFSMHFKNCYSTNTSNIHLLK